MKYFSVIKKIISQINEIYFSDAENFFANKSTYKKNPVTGCGVTGSH